VPKVLLTGDHKKISEWRKKYGKMKWIARNFSSNSEEKFRRQTFTPSFTHNQLFI
jgi:tRNA G37 N-methylase TrmD